MKHYQMETAPQKNMKAKWRFRINSWLSGVWTSLLPFRYWSCYLGFNDWSNTSLISEEVESYFFSVELHFWLTWMVSRDSPLWDCRSPTPPPAPCGPLGLGVHFYDRLVTQDGGVFSYSSYCCGFLSAFVFGEVPLISEEPTAVVPPSSPSMKERPCVLSPCCSLNTSWCCLGLEIKKHSYF